MPAPHARLVALASLTAGAALLVGCTKPMTASTARPEVVTQASHAQEAMFDRIKSLAGEWEMTDPEGRRHTAAVFTVTSAGSAVRELMFPAQEHEMTNMYTMHGGQLRLTHYCAQGNQPHMVASAAAPDRIAFTFHSVSNLRDKDETYMGELTLVFVDADHIRQEWRSFKNTVLADHNVNFELTRRR